MCRGARRGTRRGHGHPGEREKGRSRASELPAASAGAPAGGAAGPARTGTRAARPGPAALAAPSRRGRPPGYTAALRHVPADPSSPAHPASAPLEQWEAVRETLLGLGHRVSLVTPRSGMPGMVLAGHAADGRRRPGAGRALPAHRGGSLKRPAYLRWLAERGFRTRLEPVFAHEGASDLLPAGRHVLAAAAPHTELRAHSEAGQFLGLPVVPLELTDPRFTRLGGALTVLTDRTVAYFPGVALRGGARAPGPAVPGTPSRSARRTRWPRWPGRGVRRPHRGADRTARRASPGCSPWHGFRTVGLDVLRAGLARARASAAACWNCATIADSPEFPELFSVIEGRR
ncbi:hypothetical protein ACU686_17400 [Yinghuangia aomiensis]